MRDLAPGDRIAQKYRLERVVGRGGMGAVWAAQNEQLGMRVALKFIEADPGADLDDARVRFDREARAAAQIRSPHVAQIIDHGIDGDRPFIVMELLEGEDLGERLRREGRISLAATAKILTQAAKALRRAHESGIIHRDLKPGNIFLARFDDDEVVKLLDFGVAKFKNAGALDAANQTQAGIVFGSPSYMSPEQARGVRALDHRSDLWSLAVIVFRSLTGVKPFQAASIADLVVKLCMDPLPVATQITPDLPPAVDAFFARAFARDPALRFPTAVDMAAAFEAVVASVPEAQRAAVPGRAAGIGGDPPPSSGPVLAGPVHAPVVIPRPKLPSPDGAAPRVPAQALPPAPPLRMPSPGGAAAPVVVPLPAVRIPVAPPVSPHAEAAAITMDPPVAPAATAMGPGARKPVSAKATLLGVAAPAVAAAPSAPPAAASPAASPSARVELHPDILSPPAAPPAAPAGSGPHVAFSPGTLTPPPGNAAPLDPFPAAPLVDLTAPTRVVLSESALPPAAPVASAPLRAPVDAVAPAHAIAPSTPPPAPAVRLPAETMVAAPTARGSDRRRILVAVVVSAAVFGVLATVLVAAALSGGSSTAASPASAAVTLPTPASAPVPASTPAPLPSASASPSAEPTAASATPSATPSSEPSAEPAPSAAESAGSAEPEAPPKPVVGPRQGPKRDTKHERKRPRF